MLARSSSRPARRWSAGHTITTEREPLFGLVAVGFVEKDKIVRNSTARPGMHLYLSKPIGTGLITTAIKRGQTDEDVARLAVNTMTALNADASAAMVSAGVGAGTDVTGFGLLGHLRKMLDASGCAAIVSAGSVPLLPTVLDLARRDIVAGGTKRNHAWLQEVTGWGELTARTDRVGRRADEWRTPGGFGSEPVHGPVHRDRRGRAGSTGVDHRDRTGPGITHPAGSICTCNRRLRLSGRPPGDEA